MSRQRVPITIGANVFDANGEKVGEVDGLRGDLVDVSGSSIPERAFVRADANGLHLNIHGKAVGGRPPVGRSPSSTDVMATEQELMDRAVAEAARIEPPPPATGSMDDPVAGSGFASGNSPGREPRDATTVPHPFEDLSGLRRNDRNHE